MVTQERNVDLDEVDLDDLPALGSAFVNVRASTVEDGRQAATALGLKELPRKGAFAEYFSFWADGDVRGVYVYVYVPTAATR